MSDYQNIPAEYKPISMWGYFGYQILFAIPILGLIMLIIMAFAPRNKNVKNFARSYFCVLILSLVVTLVLAAIGMATGAISSIDEIFKAF